MERLSKLDYYLQIAEVVASRSPCLKKHYGAIIVKDDRIVATGYNGNPCGEPHCITCKKQLNNKSLEAYIDCQSVHAEMNCVINASKADMLDATLYLAGFDVEKQEWIDARPCEICLRLIKNAGIQRVITRAGVIYARDRAGLLKDINELAETDLMSYMAVRLGE